MLAATESGRLDATREELRSGEPVIEEPIEGLPTPSWIVKPTHVSGVRLFDVAKWQQAKEAGL